MNMNRHNPVARFNIFWMAVHFCTVFHGPVQVLTTTYVSSMLSIFKHIWTSTVVFDDYEDGPTTKDATHLRRSGTRSLFRLDSELYR